MSQFSTYNSCVQYLATDLQKSSANSLKDSAGFRKSHAILTALDNPQDSSPSIHIAATSGKGSMAYAIDIILRAHTFQTALIVSPHAYDIRERIQLNGKLIAKEDFMSLADKFITICNKNSMKPTFFEARMSMGFMAATIKQVDYAIVETGLGGLWDTSNTITRPDKLAVIGSIGLDHTHILGNTVEEIAAQKAGIMPRNGHAVVLRQSDTINDVFTATAKERNTTLHWVDPAITAYETNWVMAKTTTKLVSIRDGWNFDDQIANKAINSLTIPGRFEIRNINKHTVVLDAAHNPQKSQALAAWVKQQYPDQTFTTILAISEGKDAADIITSLNPITKHYISTVYLADQQDLPIHAMPDSELLKQIRQYSDNRTYQTTSTARDALTSAFSQQSPILITGSFYLVGELGNILNGDEFLDVL